MTVSTAFHGAGWRRLALRGLVVAGFAGAAWLLSSTAAHASDQHAAGHDAGPAAGTAGASQVRTYRSAPARHARPARTEVDRTAAGLTGLLDPLTRVLTGTLTTTVRPVTAALGQVTAPVLGSVLATADTAVDRLVTCT